MFTLSILLLVSSALALPLPGKRDVPQDRDHSHDATLRVVRSLNLNSRDKTVDSGLGLLGNAATGDKLAARTPKKKKKGGEKPPPKEEEDAPPAVEVAPAIEVTLPPAGEDPPPEQAPPPPPPAQAPPPPPPEQAPPAAEQAAATTPPVATPPPAATPTTPPVLNEQAATTPPAATPTPPVIDAAAAANCAAPAPVNNVNLNAADPPNTDPTAANTNDANLQTFTGALGGIPAPGVTKGGRGFKVENNDFVNLNVALGRSCDLQNTQCADAANANGNAGFSVGDCDAQGTACRAAIQ